MSHFTNTMIEFPSNGHTTPAFLARPTDPRPHPAIIVIQEWWGLVPHIKQVAVRFAQAGFVALAPDLYHGEIATEPDNARKLMMDLDMDRALNEILAAAHYLQDQEYVSPKRVGVVGWCMGGAASLAAAARQTGQLGAAIAFYGRPPATDEVKQITIPVLGLYGSLDEGIPVDTVTSFGNQLTSQGVPNHIEVYDGAHHAFFNNTRPQSYHPDAARDAWQRTLTWFGQHLV